MTGWVGTVYGPQSPELVGPVEGLPLTGRETLAPGVLGYATETPDGLYVGFIAAEVEGSGAVGRYLDSLPRDRRVVFPDVLSPRLAGMLGRRGFVPTVEWAAQSGELIDIWQRP